jgi:hypothetical protein
LVELNYPTEWEIIGQCSPGGDVSIKGKVTWKDQRAGPKMYACYFQPLHSKPEMNVPSKSYIVTAHTEYTFERYVIKDAKIEFGGFCCVDKVETGYSEDCIKDQQICCPYEGNTRGGACIPKDENCEFLTIGESPTLLASLNNHCAKRRQKWSNIDTGIGCMVGMGGCSTGNPDDCVNALDKLGLLFDAEGFWKGDKKYSYDLLLSPLTCSSVPGYSIKACCYTGKEVDNQGERCKLAFEEWMRQANQDSSLHRGDFYYPDLQRISDVAYYPGIELPSQLI